MGTQKYVQERMKLIPRELPQVKRADRLEESLYWLFSAATLVYLPVEIIGR